MMGLFFQQLPLSNVTHRKWEVDSAQLCQTLEKKREKRTLGKTQVVTVAAVSCFKEGYRKVFLRNLDMVKLHEVSNQKCIIC